MKVIQKDGNTFDQNTFISLIARLDLKNDSYEDILAALKLISGQGQQDNKVAKVPVGDLIYSLSNGGEKMDKDEVNEVLSDLNYLNEGNIYVEDFAKLIYNK